MPNKKLNKFIKHPKKALFTLAFPIIIIMLAQTLYNIVDTAFVGSLGTEAIAALTFAFPVFFIMLALNAGLAAGTNSRIARFIGEKKIKQAENAAMHGLLISLILALTIFIIGNIALKPLFSILGAETTTLALSLQYMRIVLVGIFFLSPAFIINNIFIAQGDTKTPMKIEISGLLLNAFLDYIFIFIFHWGVNGAAAATVASFIMYIALGTYFIKTKSQIKLKFKLFKASKRIAKEIISVGFPASLMMVLMSLYFAFLNWFMAYFSVNHVAAIGIASRLEMFSTMPIVALGIALLTLSGMFYGAKRYDLLKEIVMFTSKITMVFTALMGILLFIFVGPLTLIFTKSPELIAITSAFVRIEVFAFPFFSVSMIINRALHGMGFGLPGFVVNFARFIVITIPLSAVLIFTFGYGYLSVAVASVIGSIAAAIISFIWIGIKIRNLNHSS